MASTKGQSESGRGAKSQAELKREALQRIGEQPRTPEQQANIQAYEAAASPLLQAIEALGYRVRTVGELRDRGERYPDAVPVLLEYLPRVSYEPLKSDIIKALSVRWARPMAAPALLNEFRSIEDPSGYLRWEIGDALSFVADDSVFTEIVGLVRDARYGKAREMLALALANMKNPAAVDVLIELLDDEQLAGHALKALRKLKAPPSAPTLERLRNHPQAWVRKEVQRALDQIARDRASRRNASRLPGHEG